MTMMADLGAHGKYLHIRIPDTDYRQQKIVLDHPSSVAVFVLVLVSKLGLLPKLVRDGGYKCFAQLTTRKVHKCSMPPFCQTLTK